MVVEAVRAVVEVDERGGERRRERVGQRRRRRVQEPVNYYPVTCAAGTVVGVGLGYLGVG